MEIVRIIVTSLVAMTVLFILAKLIGNRQVSQMSLFDYITGISIGSIASEMAVAQDGEYLRPLVAMIVFGLVAALIAFITCKSIPLRKFMSGTPLLLLDKDKLYEKNFAVAKLDINEFLTQCRVAGYYNLTDLAAAVLETNGQISFLPKATMRPVCPNDMDIKLAEAAPSISLIIDGEVLTDNLRFSGKDDKWLKEQLGAQGIHSAKDVFFAACNAQNELCVFEKTKKRVRKEIFE